MKKYNSLFFILLALVLASCNGAKTNSESYFSFDNCEDEIIPSIVIPPYRSAVKGKINNSVEGQGLERLGYVAGSVVANKNSLYYHQPTWDGNYYEVLVQWKKIKN